MVGIDEIPCLICIPSEECFAALASDHVEVVAVRFVATHATDLLLFSCYCCCCFDVFENNHSGPTSLPISVTKRSLIIPFLHYLSPLFHCIKTPEIAPILFIDFPRKRTLLAVLSLPSLMDPDADLLRDVPSSSEPAINYKFIWCCCYCYRCFDVIEYNHIFINFKLSSGHFCSISGHFRFTLCSFPTDSE